MSCTRTPARVALCALTITASAVALYLTGSPVRAGVIVLLTSILATGAVVPHVLRSRGTTRRIYMLLLTGFVLMVANEASYLAVLTVGVPQSAVDALSTPTIGVSYLFVLAASALAMAPAVRHDIGGMIDAATVAVASASVLWMVFLAPALHSVAASDAAINWTFAATIVLSGSLGVVVGVGLSGAVDRSAWPALGYFLAALLIAVAGNGLNAIVTDPVTDGEVWWTDVLWPVAYVAAWAALVHPKGAAVFAVGRPRASRLTPRRLLAIGGAMLVTPVIAMARAATGGFVDWVTGATASLAITVMVLARVNQLAAAHRDTEHQLRMLAERDVLTALPNRRAVERRLAWLASRVATGDSLGAVVCFVDLDDFKGVNDTRGHAAGDDLLIAVARRLEGLARAGTDDMVGRLGGDEFLILAEGDPSHVSAPMSARIADAFADPFTLNGDSVAVSASVGMASASPSELHTVDELLTRADHAMYVDKRRHATDAR
ncbi:GGDEF domain-containing protein [Demequina sp. NBRC 110054]|uniref:GGDEF domain-containing protein n=1 Tax=Demequina sp. NBRC 110054 TaxID=1570343 RepID=UPI0009FFB4E6|nr:GGDEF domain-containing protein [Demequina sp. NBRC 110054]